MASRLIHSSRTLISARTSALPHVSRLQFGLSATRQARGMASNASTQDPKSDTAWIIGSALVFGPALIYLLGPRSTSAATHGNAHADPYQSKHGAAPALVPVTKSDTVNQSNKTVQVEPEGEEEAVSGLVGGDSAETEDDNPKTEDTATTLKTSELSKEGDATQNKDANTINAEGPNQGDVNDAIRQRIQSEAPKTVHVEGQRNN